jgi:hypothetical protein
VFSIIHSTTILLSIWLETLDWMGLVSCKMPHDVLTWWNSTFDMLVFALEYWKAINEVASGKTTGLRQYKLNNEEWVIAHQLHSSLKVHLLFPIWHSLLTCGATLADFQRRNIILLTFNTQPCDCHSSNGPY